MMNDSTGVTRRPCPTAAIVVGTVLALLMAACGSSGGSGGTPDASNSPSAVAYSACMRSHGVPNFPDPGSAGQIPKGSAQQLGVSASQYQTAQHACEHLIPAIGSTGEQQQETQCAMSDDCSQAVVQKWMSGLRTLAQCLRSHGEPTWPDPVIAAQGTPHFNYDQAGIDHHSPQVLAKVQTCINLTGFQGLPLP
jgi:hypothetical protein